MSSRASWLIHTLQANDPPRKWTADEVNKLKSFIGKCHATEMAARLGRPRHEIVSQLRRFGYALKADVTYAVGVSAVELARRSGVPYCSLHRQVQSGEIRHTREGKKDYFIPLREAERYMNTMRRHAEYREHILQQITEPTISKQEFMRRIRLAETHATRYLNYGIVRAWKVPTHWTNAGREKWEWRVSEADAARVIQLRESGNLILTPKYRREQRKMNQLIARLRRERRLGVRSTGARRAVLPGHFTISQIAQRVHLSESEVYAHIKNGRLPSVRTTVGRRDFISIPPDAVSNYEQWCRRVTKATGPITPHKLQIAQVHADGFLTVADAAAQFGINAGTLAQASAQERIPSRKIAGMIALTARDVKDYARTYRRRKTK